MNIILFDFDGTLINTWPGIEATLRASLEALDIPIREGAITPSLVGMPLAKVFEELRGDDPSSAEVVTQKYRELFPTVGMSSSEPFGGVHEMLEELKGRDKELFLVTARNEVIAKKMMDDHNLSGFFTWVRGEQEGELPDGKAHMIAEVLLKFSLAREDCVMVGDRSYDMEAALANSIQAIGVTYGYGSREELIDAGAQKLVDSIMDLEETLLGET
jgi:phosphoglycolate phosphatase